MTKAISQPILAALAAKKILKLTFVGVFFGIMSIETASAETQASLTLDKTTLYELLVAEFAGRQYQYPLASELYLKVAKRTQDPSIAARATQIAMHANQKKDAYIAAKIWVKGDPSNLKAQESLLILQLGQEDNRDSMKPLTQLLNLTKTLPKENFVMMTHEVAVATKEVTRVTDLLTSLQKSHPKDARIPLTLALLHFKEQELPKAKHWVELALSIEPYWDTAVNLKARILFANLELDKAVAYLEQTLPHLEDSEDSHALYARLLMESKEYQRAEAAFQTLVNKDEGNGDARFALALLQIEQGNLIEAKANLEALQKHFPNNANIDFYLAYLLESMGEDALAIEHYSAVNNGSNYFVAQLQAALLLAKMDKMEEAMAQLQSIEASKDSEKLELILTEARFHNLNQDYDESIALLNNAIKSEPTNSELRYSRAMTFESKGDIPKVEADLRYILTLFPKDARTLNALGYLLADKTNRYDEALELIGKAHEIEPNNPAIQDSLGWVHYRLGLYEKSIFWLQKAYTIKPDAEIAGHLGEVLWVSGQKEAAKKIWHNALETAHNKTQLQNTMQRFMNAKNP